MNKIFIILNFCIILLISNCGYEPIYQKNLETSQDLLSVSVKNIKDRSGQILRNSLINKLNPEGKREIKKYNLIIELSESKTELGVRKDMSATRTDLEISIKYILRDIENSNIILQGNKKSISSYDVVESVYATLIAEKDARKKGIEILSDDIYTDLTIFFKKK